MGFVWDNSLKTGIPEIDEQHQQLIEHMNAFVNLMKHNKGKEEIKEMFNFLDAYVQNHFSCEEGCMNQYKCPAAQENNIAHAQFINRIKELKQELEKDGSSLTLVIKLSNELLGWFLTHIRQVDMQLKSSVSHHQ